MIDSLKRVKDSLHKIGSIKSNDYAGQQLAEVKSCLEWLIQILIENEELNELLRNRLNDK